MKKIFFSSLILLVACQAEDPAISDFYGTVNVLSGGPENTKTWKVSSATLTQLASGSTEIITDLANVQDDEFVFTSENQNGLPSISLSWRKRNEIRPAANNSKEAILDYYLSPLVSELSINAVGEISVPGYEITIEKISDQALQASVVRDQNKVQFELIPAQLTSNELPETFTFQKLADISGLGLEQAAGFTGSMVSNSLYIAYKSLEGEKPERVVKYDIAANTFKVQDFSQQDFVTKEMHIINDQLKIVGGQRVNTYSLDLTDLPVSAPHNLTLTRFGSTVVDDNVFIFGGALNTDPSVPGANANAIYQHDQITGTLKLIGNLPEPRYWAHGQIMDNALYVFGGRKSFITSEAEDDIFIFNMTSGETETLQLPTPLHRTFASRYKNYIIVGGQHETTISGSPARETVFGVFDTHDKTFTVKPTSLTFTNPETIFGLTVVGKKLYILKSIGVTSNFEIYEANL